MSRRTHPRAYNPLSIFNLADCQVFTKPAARAIFQNRFNIPAIRTLVSKLHLRLCCSHNSTFLKIDVNRYRLEPGINSFNINIVTVLLSEISRVLRIFRKTSAVTAITDCNILSGVAFS